MKGYIANIEKDTLANTDFRRVLYTAKNSQLVLMSIAAGEDIGEEVSYRGERTADRVEGAGDSRCAAARGGDGNGCRRSVQLIVQS